MYAHPDQKQLPPQQVIEVNGKLYQVNFTEIAPYQSRSAHAPVKQARDTDQTPMLITVGAAISGAFLLSLLVTRALMPAPQASPIVVQPQPPAPRRNYTKDCRPTGLFGWNTVCEEREFWQ